jgi:putative transposase
MVDPLQGEARLLYLNCGALFPVICAGEHHRNVVVVQRFGGALNLNVHVHAFMLDGGFTTDGDAVRFHDPAGLLCDHLAGA